MHLTAYKITKDSNLNIILAKVLLIVGHKITRLAHNFHCMVKFKV